MLKSILVPISLGELIDKITILEIKSTLLAGNALSNVNKELKALSKVFDSLDTEINIELIRNLRSINSELWKIEDQIRDKERNNEFDEEFINIARSIYKKNDERASIKMRINTKYGSDLTEEKSYKYY